MHYNVSVYVLHVSEHENSVHMLKRWKELHNINKDRLKESIETVPVHMMMFLSLLFLLLLLYNCHYCYYQ